MSKYKFNNVRMSAQSVVVPENEINIYDEAQYYDNNIKRIDRMRKMVGFHKRRVSDRDVAPSYYAIDAAERLFKETNIDRNSIDALIYMTQKPDWSDPSACFYLHHKLGLSSECAVITVNHGCPAWVYGMWTAAQMVSSGANKRVLLLCADTFSIGIDPTNRISAPIFGDAGCATLLEYNENAAPMYFNIETYSDGFDTIITPVSGTHCLLSPSNHDDLKMINELATHKIKTPAGHETSVFNSHMDGMAVFNFTITKVPQNIRDLMVFANISEQDIRYLCLHQANKQIIQTVATEAGFPLEKAPFHAFETYGNNTMCSIPTTLNTVVKDAGVSDNEKLLCSGFGNGLAVASLLLTLDANVKLCDVSDWKRPADFMTREQYLEYWKNKLSTTNH